MVRILYFAALADTLGRTSEQLELPAGVATVAELLESLRQRGDPWHSALVKSAVRVTVNRGFATAETAVAEGDEIALMPKRA
ncbi:MAG TPA: MoaD/ThiS family protein [Burkholderiales bacterium]|jgi:molybdopterin synthase sulfur carrier subunit|nr:MoaD/ThiS family protein [Burkholderiales bacterium]